MPKTLTAKLINNILSACLLLLLFFPFYFLHRYLSGGPDECEPAKGANNLVTVIGETNLKIPVRYLSLCFKTKKDPWPSFFLTVSYPDFKPFPDRNRENHEDILRRRLTITLSDNLETRTDINNIVFENRKTGLEIVNGIESKIYPHPPRDLPNGLIHYVPKAERPENNKDLFVQKDKSENVTFMLECYPRVVGGSVCSRDYIFIKDLKITYSYDMSHVFDALKIDEDVKKFISSMILENQ